VIFRHLDEAPARRFYERTPSADGYVISLWHPDGTLIASSGSVATKSAITRVRHQACSIYGTDSVRVSSGTAQ
jgi:hypothetical protein